MRIFLYLKQEDSGYGLEVCEVKTTIFCLKQEVLMEQEVSRLRLFVGLVELVCIAVRRVKSTSSCPNQVRPI